MPGKLPVSRNKLLAVAALIVAISGGIILSANSRSKAETGSEGFSSAEQAARHVLDQANPVSIATNQEIGGYIYQKPDGRFYTTPYSTGGFGNVSFPALEDVIPESASVVASWHTHGAPMEGVVSEIFSPRDVRYNKQHQLDGYLSTPSGQFKFYDLTSGEVTVLGVVRTD